MQRRLPPAFSISPTGAEWMVKPQDSSVARLDGREVRVKDLGRVVRAHREREILTRTDGGCFAEFARLRLRVPNETLAARPALAGYMGKSIVLGIRPEDMEDPQFLPTQVADAQIPVVVAHRENR